ncbi:uncharacterized protein LOC135396107 [Ornithodoros turicata]|uniref:uncharacterized protein LOC135396107 n=1 Tax=Ornithodoros turicata TaxID=34597 RepID=UPI003139204D
MAFLHAFLQLVLWLSAVAAIQFPLFRLYVEESRGSKISTWPLISVPSVMNNTMTTRTPNTSFGDPCATDEDCTSATGFVCIFGNLTATSRCGCNQRMPVFIRDAEGLKCVKPRALFEPCTSNLECKYNSPNAQCNDSVCVCKLPFVTNLKQECVLPTEKSVADMLHGVPVSFLLLFLISLFGAAYTCQKLCSTLNARKESRKSGTSRNEESHSTTVSRPGTLCQLYKSSPRFNASQSVSSHSSRDDMKFGNLDMPRERVLLSDNRDTRAETILVPATPSVALDRYTGNWLSHDASGGISSEATTATSSNQQKSSQVHKLLTSRRRRETTVSSSHPSYQLQRNETLYDSAIDVGTVNDRSCFKQLECQNDFERLFQQKNRNPTQDIGYSAHPEQKRQKIEHGGDSGNEPSVISLQQLEPTSDTELPATLRDKCTVLSLEGTSPEREISEETGTPCSRDHFHLPVNQHPRGSYSSRTEQTAPTHLVKMEHADQEDTTKTNDFSVLLPECRKPGTDILERKSDMLSTPLPESNELGSKKVNEKISSRNHEANRPGECCTQNTHHIDGRTITLQRKASRDEEQQERNPYKTDKALGSESTTQESHDRREDVENCENATSDTQALTFETAETHHDTEYFSTNYYSAASRVRGVDVTEQISGADSTSIMKDERHSKFSQELKSQDVKSNDSTLSGSLESNQYFKTAADALKTTNIEETLCCDSPGKPHAKVTEVDESSASVAGYAPDEKANFQHRTHGCSNNVQERSFRTPSSYSKFENQIHDARPDSKDLPQMDVRSQKITEEHNLSADRARECQPCEAQSAAVSSNAEVQRDISMELLTNMFRNYIFETEALATTSLTGSITLMSSDSASNATSARESVSHQCPVKRASSHVKEQEHGEHSPAALLMDKPSSKVVTLKQPQK